MRGTTVLAAALLLAAAAPVAAQQYTWTDDRPDGVAPVGIWGDHTLPAGTVEGGYRFTHATARGLVFGKQVATEESVLALGFNFVPIERTVQSHIAQVGIGVTDWLTVNARGGWIAKNRTSANDSVLFFNETSGISDIQADALWDVYHQGAYRAHLHTGVIIPTGAVDARGDFGPASDVQLPYDMQIGSGSWAVVPGATAQVMNNMGSVGVQIRGVFPVADNSRGWRPGARIEGALWAGYRFNDFVSVSGGFRAMQQGAIKGFDIELETLRDPGDLALSTKTKKVEMPLGMNLRIPGGALAGQRLSIEAVWTVHEETDGPLLKDDWALNLGWSANLDAKRVGGFWPF
jgi:hypothetical protein